MTHSGASYLKHRKGRNTHFVHNKRLVQILQRTDREGDPQWKSLQGRDHDGDKVYYDLSPFTTWTIDPLLEHNSDGLDLSAVDEIKIKLKYRYVPTR